MPAEKEKKETVKTEEEKKEEKNTGKSAVKKEKARTKDKVQAKEKAVKAEDKTKAAKKKAAKTKDKEKPAKKKTAKAEDKAQTAKEEADKQEKTTEPDEGVSSFFTTDDEDAENTLAVQSAHFEECLSKLVKTAAKKKNVIEYLEIGNCFPGTELNQESMENIVEYLEGKGMDVLRTDINDDDLILDLDDEAEKEDTEEEIAEVDLALADMENNANIEDHVRMYLKEIGKVPLLTSLMKK